MLDWFTTLLYAHPVEVLVGIWLTIASLALWSVTRSGYNVKPYYGGMRYKRDSNRTLKERKK